MDSEQPAEPAAEPSRVDPHCHSTAPALSVQRSFGLPERLADGHRAALDGQAAARNAA